MAGDLKEFQVSEGYIAMSRSDRLHRRDLGKKMPDVDPQDRHPALQSMCSKD